MPSTGLQFAGGDQFVVDGGEAVGVDHHFVVQDVAFALPGEVEVGVVGEVDDGGLVGGGGVIDLELVLRGEGVDHFRGQGAGKAFLAILADVGQLERLAVGAGTRDAVQIRLSKPAGPPCSVLPLSLAGSL